MISKLHYISQLPEKGGHLDAINQALEAGCKWIQLRVKNEPVEAILEYALAARKLCNEHGAKLIINDFPEIALEAGADGVHLGFLDISLARAREIVGRELIIGGTANTFEDVELRVREGADYIGLGPYRFTATKLKLSPIVGLEGYEKILSQVKAAGITVPLIAVGGILTEDLTAIMQTGFHGVAMSGAITFSPERSQTVARIYELVNAAPVTQAS